MQRVSRAVVVAGSAALVALWAACLGEDPPGSTTLPDAGINGTGLDSGADDASPITCDSSAPLGEAGAFCGSTVTCEAGTGCCSNGTCTSSKAACVDGGSSLTFFECTRYEHCTGSICCVRGTVDPPSADPCTRTMTATGSECTFFANCETPLCAAAGECPNGFACRPTRIFLGAVSAIVDVCIRAGE